MNVDNFIETASYEIGEVIDQENTYRIIMGTDEYDIWFIYKDNEIIRYEAYCDIGDYSITLNEQELEKFKTWTEHCLKTEVP